MAWLSAGNASDTRPKAPRLWGPMIPTASGALTTTEFMLGNKQYCYPLTITDYRSRYLLTCEGLTSTRTDFAFSVFERAFDFGLPNAIRTDNGVPFASGNALRFIKAARWLRLGINLQRMEARTSV